MITTTNANNILKFFFGQQNSIVGTGKCYLGLSTTTPNADGTNFTEPSTSTGYARVQVNINEAQQYTNKMTEPTNGSIENNAEITFPEALEPNGYGTVTHFGIFDTQNGGTPLYVHALTSSVSVGAGEVLLFRQGALSLSFTADEE